MSSNTCFICDKAPVVGQIGKLNLCRKHFGMGRICHTCNMFFISSNEKAIYCSSPCIPRGEDKTGEKVGPSPYGICPTCEKEFEKNTPNHKYCCDECRETDNKKSHVLIFDRDDYQCIYCGRTSYRDGVVLHLDHIMARSKGGSNRAFNIVTACVECNGAKGNKAIKNIDLILEEVARRNKRDKINPKQKIKFPKRRYEE